MAVRRVVEIGFGGLLVAAALFGGSQPVPVSPGTPRGSLIGDACPAFSWGAVEGANTYELVAYRVGEEGEELPVLRETLPGSASSWTPSLARCLERGAQYAWSVRAVGRKGASQWSSPSLFTVASGPSQLEFEEAFAVVRRYMAAQGGLEADAGAVEGGAQKPPAAQGASPSAPAPSAPPQVALHVTGGVLATSFAGDGSALTNLDPTHLSGGQCEGFPVSGRRWLDRGDGTVRDCNTGKIWLKDADCLPETTWDGIVPSAIASLNAGTDFGCAEYTPGAYIDWEAPAMTDLCGLWDGSCTGTTCCTASQGVVDTTVSGSPKVANGTGDSRWTPGNVFVGVRSNEYWSATDAASGTAWAINLGSGSVHEEFHSFYLHNWAVRGGP